MPSSPPRYFLDTEGKTHLTEVAVVDEQGTCVYEAFAEDSSKHQYKSLHTICCELAEHLSGSTVVCHYAEHDREILKRSFRQAGVSFPNIRFVCTMQLARRLFPAGLGSTSKWQHSSSAQFSYSLQHLSHAFQLQLDGKRFNDAYAHSARYDAMFTRMLHDYLIHYEGERRMMDTLKTIPNPFSSSRVDDPFQQHPDLPEVYGEQFQGLLSTLDELAHDPNHQSRGAVVIGEPGSGKTHLMMRLARAKLKSNPLFYVRQPNNPENVLYHTYARVIESLFEAIPDTPYTQLQRFFGHSFLQILRDRPEAADTERGSKIISTLEQNSLSLFQREVGKDSKQYYDEWKFILNHVSRYWGERYSSAGHAVNILKAFVRYCGYLDNERRGLTRRYFTAHQLDKDDLAKVGLEDWSEDIDREGFALEAMTVLGRLSILDEPLILVFDQLEGLSHKPDILERFADAVKDILSYVPNSLVIFNLFPDRWQQFQNLFDESVLGRIAQVQVRLDHPDREHLAAILDYKAQQAGVSFAEIFDRSEQNDILQQTSIRAALNRAAAHYRHKTQGAPLTFIDAPKTSAPKTSAVTPTDNQTTGNLEQRVAKLEQTMSALAQALTGNLAAFSTASSQPTTNDTEAELEIDLTDFDPIMQMLEDEIHTRREHLEARYDQAQIIDDEDDLGKLMTLADVYARYRPITIDNVRLGRSKVPANLSIQVNSAPANVISFLYADSGAFTARIKNFNKLVIHHPDMHFTLLRDQREKPISGKVGVQEIDKLNNAKNGTFRLFDRTDRVNFELAYELLVAVQNRDLDASEEDVLKALEQHMGNWWLLECFH